MRALRIYNIYGYVVEVVALDNGTVRFERGDLHITLDAASVAKLRDWLADDCCDMRRGKE